MLARPFPRSVRSDVAVQAFGQRCGALESEGRQAKLRFKLLNYTHTRGSDLTLLGPLPLRRRGHVDKTRYLTGIASSK